MPQIKSRSRGIYNEEDLKSVGAEQAWLKIQQIDESACIHRLLALEGAIQGVKKTLLPEERKKELKEFYNWNKNITWDVNNGRERN